MAQNARWIEHYRDEKDAVFLYRALAEVESDEKHRDLFTRLAAVEDRHVERWIELFTQDDQTVPTHHPSRRTRLLAWAARRFARGVDTPRTPLYSLLLAASRRRFRRPAAFAREDVSFSGLTPSYGGLCQAV